MPRGDYSPELIDTALHVLAANAGNSVRTEEALTAAGTRVPSSTLSLWKTGNYRDRYAEIQAARAPMLEARAIANSLEIIDIYADLEKKAADLLDQAMASLPPKELANTVSKLAVAKGINTDKALLLQGRPTQVTEHRDTNQLIKALQALNPALIIESTTTEDTQPSLASG